MLSKEPREQPCPGRDDELQSDYYYDDSTGYLTYDPDTEEDESEDEEDDQSVPPETDHSARLL